MIFSNSSDVLVVIVSYNNIRILEQCLQALSAQTYQNFDAVVWDNGSFCSPIKDKYKSKKLRFHLSEENLLWSPAVNSAIEMNLKKRHKYILIMNNDIILPRCGIERVIKVFYDQQDNPGIVGPAGSSLGGLQDYISHRPIPGYYDWDYDLHEKIKNAPSARSCFISGAIFMVSRKLYDTIGGLDPSMPLGADDFDYSIRAKEAGFSIWVTYSTYVNHIGHATGDSENWNGYGKMSWDNFNHKYDGYFVSEEESIKSLWGAKYDSRFPLGTGLSLDEKIERGIVCR